jgi:hypothetical protein
MKYVNGEMRGAHGFLKAGFSKRKWRKQAHGANKP